MTGLRSFGTLLACAALALGACGGSDEDAWVVKATFFSGEDLPLGEGDPVRINGEEVGEVGAIEDGPRRTKLVELRIEDEESAPLSLDTSFRIRSGGVEVKPGTSLRKAAEGDIFPGVNSVPVP
jgi:ABC-type transporter Mla subunit MlaD